MRPRSASKASAADDLYALDKDLSTPALAGEANRVELTQCRCAHRLVDWPDQRPPEHFPGELRIRGVPI